MAGKNYAAIARQRIHRPSATKRKPRFLVYGRNKKGKTRFGATAPNVLVVDPEQGTEEETRIDPDVWQISKWSDMDDVYGFLRSKDARSPLTNEPYQWVNLDGMTRIYGIARDFIRSIDMERDLSRKPSDTKIQDWGRANTLVEAMLHNFHALRHIGIVLTAQERMEIIVNMEDYEGDEEASAAGHMYVPDLPKGARSSLNQVVDVIGRIYVVRGEFESRYRDPKDQEVKTRTVTKQRRLWIGPHEMYDTGIRSGFELPDYITNPTVPRLVRAMREGKV